MMLHRQLLERGGYAFLAGVFTHAQQIVEILLLSHFDSLAAPRAEAECRQAGKISGQKSNTNA